MPSFLITSEQLPGPTYRLSGPPSLLHPHPCAIGDLGDRSIWRYLDLPKYLAMLSTSALYFTRADQLTKMDPMERSWGQPDLQGELAEANARARQSLYTFMGKYFVSCWHLNEFESAAMWDIYGQKGASVALRTSLRKFTSTLVTGRGVEADDWRLVPLEVQYLDYEKQGIGNENALNLLRSKRRSYEHEREIRMTLVQPSAVDVDSIVGVYLPFDFSAMIDAIYFNPQAPTWLFETLSEVSRHYGIRTEILRQSGLDTKPLI